MEEQTINNNIETNVEQLKRRACEMEEQVTKNVNELMNNTAETLDQAADKMRNTAEFFRHNDAAKIKENVSTVIQRNPGKSLLAAIALGFLVGKAFFR